MCIFPSWRLWGMTRQWMGRSNTEQISGSEHLGNLRLLWELLENGSTIIWSVISAGVLTTWLPFRKAKLRSSASNRPQKSIPLAIYTVNVSHHPFISPPLPSPPVHPAVAPSNFPSPSTHLPVPHLTYLPCLSDCLPSSPIHPFIILPPSGIPSLHPFMHHPTYPSSIQHSIHPSLPPYFHLCPFTHSFCHPYILTQPSPNPSTYSSLPH